ncbi:BQ5605_C001g00307 [Microbotryum silenes-dioicae]|uniref:BQ5605_C001g00307 protein n=1 Tax=Microbotryum silenes-dioicae TaxID=796604 RepID=A0A2X0M760_9BASI|nr:BQ5605_C001g00307 [Microbotryum silenes-dioicae]
MVDVLDTPPMFHDKLSYDAYCAAVFAEEDIEIPKTFEEAMKSPYCNHWSAAMVSELLQFDHHGVFQEVKWHEGIRVLGTIWVYSIKRNANSKIIRFKARLVAQGFAQRPGIDYHDTYAPVARSSMILFLIALAAAQGLYLEQFNFDCAFLNGKMTEDVYVRYPKGWNRPQSPGKCLKLVGSMYGTKQAPRYMRATADACLYIKHSGTSFAIITLYVDDGLIASNNQSFLDSELGSLHKAFQLKRLGPVSYFLGFEIHRTKDYILVHQSKYVRTMLEKFDFSSPSKRRAITPMDDRPSLRIDTTPFADVSLYQSAVGSLQYASTRCRPDIAIAVRAVAQKNSCPTVDDWAAVKHIFRYLNSTIDLGILYRNSSTTRLMVYSDASFADDPESRRSVGAYASMLAGGVISWQSNQQSMIATSTTKAEILSASSATREAIWLRRLAGDVGIPQAQPTIIQEDNAACIQIAKDPVDHMRTKHFDIAHLFVRERVASGEVELEYCPTHVNAADIMTKPLGFQRFDQLRALLGMVSLVSLTGGSFLQKQKQNGFRRMVRLFALVKIYGMAREGRSLVSGQYPRVKARLVSLYWIAFLSAPTAQQPALEIQPREDIRRSPNKKTKKTKNGETSTARYIVNGFLTETVRLLCGLGQGNPLSSSVWDVVFQPFLDSLSRRNIALTITLPELAPRPQTRCITNLAFADDAVVAVAGPEAIASLEALARDWRLATNGRLNTDKTVVMPLGTTLWDRADLSKLSFVAPDESLPWIGLQFAPDGNNRLGFHDLERRVDRVILSVRDRWMTHHTRAFYLNRYGISKVLHSLSADIPPSDVIKAIERKLADFVKGRPRRSDYKQSVVFTTRARGGLSVVSIQDVVDSVSVRIWDVLAGGSTAIWGDLARSSIRRALPTFDFAADLWTWRNADAPRELHPRWRAVLSVAERYPAVVDPAKLSVPNFLSLSPLQPGLHDSRAFSEQDKRLAKHFSFERTIADIYARAQYPAAPTVPWTPEKHPQGDGSELSNLWQWKRDQVQAWIQVAGDRFIPPLPPPVPVLARRPPVIRVVGAPGVRPGGPLEHVLPRATPVGMPDQKLPLPSAPFRADQWKMLSLDRPYTIARLRRVINHRRFDDTQRPGSLATPKERRLFWVWFNTGPATAREREVHFKLAYHFTPTRKRQFVQRHGDSACCLVQACSLAGVEDDFTHFWHDCPDSSQFWQAARSILCDALGVVSILDLDYTALQIEHGLPRLRARLPTSKKRPIRAFIALARDTLSNRRWDLHRHARAMSSMDKEMAGLKERLELRLAR